MGARFWTLWLLAWIAVDVAFGLIVLAIVANSQHIVCWLDVGCRP
jgi:hypothetical protein